MAIRFDLDPELQARWLPILERQVGLTLTPMVGSLKSASIKFSAFRAEADGEIRYLCELEGRGEDGLHLQFKTRHRDGQTAIHDTTARARRAIARSLQHKASGRLRTATN